MNLFLNFGQSEPCFSYKVVLYNIKKRVIELPNDTMDNEVT